jgi:hypothetical protein
MKSGRQRWRLAVNHLHVVDARGRAVDELPACHRGVVLATVARLGVTSPSATVATSTATGDLLSGASVWPANAGFCSGAFGGMP